MLLGATGGMLDAVVYLNHGHVFANAMTGNVVLLGISTVTADWSQILPHLAPIVAYVFGVSASRLIRALPLRHGTLITLSLEIATLFAAGFLSPSFPQMVFTATIAFVSAFQVSTFRHVGTFTYNSTFVTGNLRDVVEGWWDHRLKRDPAARYKASQKSWELGLICLCFLSGATAGALVAPRAPVHAVWFAEPMLLGVLVLTLLRPPEAQKL
jgi:uncharacterized membrane protein YoaK (UPF0700 family)